MTVSVVMARADDMSPRMEQIVAIYGAVFTGAPYFEGEDDVAYYAERLVGHVRRPGFRASLAWDGGTLVGFAYGFASRRESWLWQQLYSRLPKDEARYWTANVFELVELALLPEARGQGAGSRLHDLVLDGIAQPRALLATADLDSPAMTLYRKRGWRALVGGIHYGSQGLIYTIMGREVG